MSSLDNPQIITEPVSPWPTITRYGLIGGLVLIVFSMLGILTGFSSPAAGLVAVALNMVVMLGLYIVLMVLAVKQQRDLQGGFISFGSAFLVAFGVGFIVSIISTLFTFVYLNYIDPGYLDKIIADSQEMWERFNMNEEQMEAAREQTMRAGEPVYMLRQMGFGAIFGAIISLIIGAVMKKKPAETIG